MRPTLETAQAIAAALDTDAASIRAGAGLVAELRRVMAITNERDATKSELHGLPPRMRRVFVRYYLARAEIAAAEREMQDAGNQHISALRASNHASDICTARWVALFASDVNDDARLGYRESLEALRRQNELVPPAAERFAVASRRSLAALTEFGTASLRVTQLVLPFV